MLNQTRLIQTLAARMEADSGQAQLFETHISWVLVCGEFAYKFKKALRLEYLDYSTLEVRHLFCEEELRLNRRLAPELYLGVVAITGTAECPQIDGDGGTLDYAVKMRAFPQASLWDYRLRHRLLSGREVDALAAKLARFHLDAARAPCELDWGTPEALAARTCEDLASIAALLSTPNDALGALLAWQSRQQAALEHSYIERKAGGYIRECHGDLHCGNILTWDDRVEVFDGIEFNEGMRWIDVMHDFAFIYMDLRFRGRSDLAARLLNHYLGVNGDYAGLAVLAYYQTQRALVRAKVGLLRAQQLRRDGQDGAPDAVQAARYLDFALARSRPGASFIVITHGFSGSGKSTIARHLVELLGAVQIRSDVERKRMHGLAPTSDARAAPGAGLYDAASGRMTYARLRELARQISAAGLPVIVDAAFLMREQRQQFEDLARELGVPFLILDIAAPVPAMQERIQLRAQHGQDPSDAHGQVLAHQIASHEALSDEEKKYVIGADGERGDDSAQLREIADSIILAQRQGTGG